MPGRKDDRLGALEERIKRLEASVEEQRIAGETRLAAIQFLVAQLLRQIYVLIDLTDEEVRANHEKALNAFRSYVQGHTNSSVPHYVSSEIEYWIRDTLKDAEEMRRIYQSRGSLG